MRELAEAIANKRIILFAGSGLSSGLGIPTGRELLQWLASELGMDPAEFVTMGELRELAEYYLLKKGSLAVLSALWDKQWHRPEIDISQSRIHELIVQFDFPLIYTTNYDRWLERAFDYHRAPYTKIVDVKDLTNTKPGATQIVKFHGDFDDPSSLVFTETDYLNRLELESALDIKLRSDILGRAILFLGSSLTDINVRFLLYKLTKAWGGEQSPLERPQSYFFMAKPNPVQETILRARRINCITAGSNDPTASMERFLSQLLEEVNSVRVR